jgi:multicomponent K+:H+ antiporter subunit G
MNHGMEISVFSGLLSAILLVGGAAITLTGSLGLLRFPGFYQRVHAPTLGTTLGTTCIALASIIYFSSLESRVAFHELLIIVFVTATTPISLMILIRAAILRDESEAQQLSHKK